MRSRTRLAAVAAAAGLAAGVLGVGFNPNPAGAAPTVLIECDQVSATATVSKGITNVTLGQKLSTTASQVDGGCTNVYGAITGGPAATNPLSVKLATPNKAPFGDPTTQGLSCASPQPPTTYPPSGKARLTFTNLSPSGKPYAADMFLRLGGVTDEDVQEASGDPSVVASDYPDLTKVNGLVTKGPGLGADVTGLIFYQPTGFNKLPITGASYISGGQIVPQFPSAGAGLTCQSGGGAITQVLIATDGASLGTFLNPTLPSIDSSFKIQFPG